MINFKHDTIFYHFQELVVDLLLNRNNYRIEQSDYQHVT